MAENTGHDYYADLGLKSGATVAQIKSAFHQLAKIYHPDRKGPGHDGDASEFRKAREAYETLSDPARKAAYDRTQDWHAASYSPTPSTPAEADFRSAKDSAAPEPKFSMGDFWSSINPPGGFQRTGAGRSATSNYRSAVPLCIGSRALLIKRPLTEVGVSKHMVSTSG